MNTILIVCDTWRRDHIGCYGNDWIRTPNVDRLAERGAVFDNCYCGSFPTLPCRNDIITGKYEFPWQGWSGPAKDATTLSGLIHDSGRVSYLITDIYHHWGKAGGSFWCDFSGFELIRGQERDRYITDADAQPDYPAPEYEQTERIKPHLRNVKFLRRNEEDWFAPQVFSRAIRWIQHNAAHRDFFLMIDAFDPHEPWDPPKHYVDLYGDPDYGGYKYVTPQYRPIKGYLSEEEFNYVKALYAGEITMVDKWIGRFLDQVETMGLMDRTMIIITTDHGTYLGDHGQVGKLQTYLYQGISHTPMIVWHPEFAGGQRLDPLVQPIDIFPTVLEAAGLEAPAGLHGKSLFPLLRDGHGEAWREVALFARHEKDLNITDGEYVLYQIDGARKPKDAERIDPFLCEEAVLFHLPTDPKEESNLAKSDHDGLLYMKKLLKHNLDSIHAPAELLDRYGLNRI